jgi:DNA repair protein RadC
MKTWTHPGGKLIELGPHALTQDELFELFEILIGTGYKGRTAQDIAKELLDNYFSVYGLLGKTRPDLSKIKGLKNGKIKRIAAVFEIAKRITSEQKRKLPAIKKITLELPDLSDAEILAVLIGSGCKEKTPNGLAKELLKKYKSLSGIMGKKLSDMAKIEGLGDVKIVRIAAAYEIALRLVKILEAE